MWQSLWQPPCQSRPSHPDGGTPCPLRSRTNTRRQALPVAGGHAMQKLPKALGMFCLAAILWLGGLAAALAQGGPNLGRPQIGETILNRDVEVHVSPDESSRIVMPLPKGKTVAAFGT